MNGSFRISTPQRAAIITETIIQLAEKTRATRQRVTYKRSHICMNSLDAHFILENKNVVKIPSI